MRITACMLFLATTAMSQKVHIVGPTGFAEIRDALAVALPGDEIRVLAGRGPFTYQSIDVRIGVTIRVVPGVHAVLDASRCRVPQGQRLRIVNLHTYDLAVDPGAGTLVIEDCTLFDAVWRSAPGVITIVGARVLFAGSAVTATRRTTTIHASNSTVAMRGTTAVGAFRSVLGYGCQDTVAVALSGSTLHAVGADIRGGDEGFCTGSSRGVAIQADAGSRVWLAGSRISGGTNVVNPRSPSLINGSQVPIFAFRCSLLGPVQGPIDSNAPLVAGIQTAPPRIGQSFVATFEARQGEPLLVVASAALDGMSLPVVAQPIWFLPGPAAPIVSAGIAGATGRWGVAMPVPNDARLVGRAVWLHGVGLTPAGLQAALPLGGEIRG